MWKIFKRRKPIKKGCDLTIEEAMILTGAKRVMLWPELEKKMDEARFHAKYGYEDLI